MWLADVQWESATCSWPCENTDVHRSRPTFLTDWPCDLFMVIAIACQTGNCLTKIEFYLRQHNAYMHMIYKDEIWIKWNSLTTK